MRDFFNTFFRVIIRLDKLNDIARCDITDHIRGIKRPCVVIPIDRNGIYCKNGKLYFTVSCRPIKWSPRKNKKLLSVFPGVTHTVTTYISSSDIDKCMEKGVAEERDDLIVYRDIGMVTDYGTTISEEERKNGEKPRISNKANYIAAVVRYIKEKGKNPYSTRYRNLDKRDDYNTP